MEPTHSVSFIFFWEGNCPLWTSRFSVFVIVVGFYPPQTLNETGEVSGKVHFYSLYIHHKYLHFRRLSTSHSGSATPCCLTCGVGLLRSGWRVDNERALLNEASPCMQSLSGVPLLSKG